MSDIVWQIFRILDGHTGNLKVALSFPID